MLATGYSASNVCRGGHKPFLFQGPSGRFSGPILNPFRSFFAAGVAAPSDSRGLFGAIVYECLIEVESLNSG